MDEQRASDPAISAVSLKELCRIRTQQLKNALSRIEELEKELEALRQRPQ